MLRAFGRRLYHARKALGWTQADLARRAKLDRYYVAAIERGERNVALLNINRLAIALDEDFQGLLPFRLPL